MSAAALVPLVVVVAVFAIDCWVYSDASRHSERGTPVVFQAGSVVIDTPVMWFVGCLVLWIFIFPLYLTSR